MSDLKATGSAFANVALVKYFGKRDKKLNLPAAGSLSLTLDSLKTETKIFFDSTLKNDKVYENNKLVSDHFAKRVTDFLNIVRALKKTDCFAYVKTKNSFPTAAGLASSASGFAALAVAACKALDLNLTQFELSALARRGSGSAARSICGGIVVWNKGIKKDGSDSFGHTIADVDFWDLRMVIGISDKLQKKIGSTQAMEQTRITSPYYNNWIDSAKIDLVEATDAVKNKDFEKLGEISERSALSMHAAIMAARPSIVYFNQTTVAAIHLIKELRQNGIQAYFTCDAGPQPKVLCQSQDEDKVVSALSDLAGIKDIICCRLADKAQVLKSN